MSWLKKLFGAEEPPRDETSQSPSAQPVVKQNDIFDTAEFWRLEKEGLPTGGCEAGFRYIIQGQNRVFVDTAKPHVTALKGQSNTPDTMHATVRAVTSPSSVPRGNRQAVTRGPHEGSSRAEDLRGQGPTSQIGLWLGKDVPSELKDEIIQFVSRGDGDRDRLTKLIERCKRYGNGLSTLTEARRVCNQRWHALAKDLDAAIRDWQPPRTPEPSDRSDNRAVSAAQQSTGTLYVCDICAASIEKTSGYAYTTRQVLTSVRYWRREFETIRNQATDGSDVGLVVSMLSDFATAWIVCEECVQYIDADSKVARRFAAEGREPPGCGPVDRKIASIPAAYGWSLVHNEWPVSVRVGKNPITHDPSVGTRCDFCRRIVYGDEKFGVLGVAAYKKQLDNGVVFVRTPAPRCKIPGGEGGWVACFTCLERRG